MSEHICKVTIQGVSQDLTKSTGEFDDIIEYGFISFEEMKDVLTQFSQVELITFSLDDPKEETSPANITILNDGNEFVFIANGSKLYSSLIDDDVSVSVAYKMITGQVDANSMKKPPSQEYQDSMVRMKSVDETAEMLNENSINTDSLNMQISSIVWKSKGWKDWKNIFLGIALFFVALSPLMLLEKPDYGTAFGLVFLSIPFFVIAWVIKRKGHTLFKLGFDWNTNTIWTKHGEKFNWNKNANTIIDFQVVKNVEYVSGSAGVVLMSDGGALGNGNEVSWILQVNRKNNSDRAIAIFATKKEATDVLNKAQTLLHQFN